MDENLFQECLENWKNSAGNSSTSFWPNLAAKYNYSSIESLRSEFKRERSKRGIIKTDGRTIQQNPIVGVMDVETLPIRLGGDSAYIWGIRDQYITYDMVEKDSHMLSWAGKYLYNSEIYSDIMNPIEAITYDSKRITSTAMQFINSCDIIIGHNWDYFDGKIINSELMYNELPPVKYRSIDTYKLLKAHFRETSYKLKDINKKYGIRNKVSNEGFELWKKCAKGDKKSLNEMLIYNQGDILSTEDLFWKIQPYVNNALPNFSTYKTEETRVCHCGSDEFLANGYWYTQQAKYNRLRCAECGSVHRGKKNLLSKDKTKSLLIRL